MTEFREKAHAGLPFVPDEEWLQSRLRCGREGLLFKRALELFTREQANFSPAYLLREFPLGQIGDSGFAIGGREFRSKTVAQRLKQRIKGADTVFVYIATCGRGSSRAARGARDRIDRYLLDQLAYGAYLSAMSALAADIDACWGAGKYRILCPGSVADWSVAEVRQFFDLLDGLYQQLDLRVLDSGQIEPLQSSSGIIYATNEGFESCSLCPRPKCESRRADFGPGPGESDDQLALRAGQQ